MNGGEEGSSVGSGPARSSAGRHAPAAGAHDPRVTVIQNELFDERRPKWRRYSDLVVGRPGVLALVKHELVTCACGWLPGAVGLAVRSRLYPLLLGKVGRNVTFGTGVVLRHPHKISIGDNVVIDDACCLDAKGTDNRGIEIGTGVFVGRSTILSCKNGDIVIGDGANIGFNCEIFAAGRVRIGRNVLMAAYTYLVGGDHLHESTEIPVLHQGRSSAGIDIGDNVWLGAHVVVTDGTVIGRDAIVGAGSVVVGDIPEYHVAVGSPARTVRDRRAPRAGGSGAAPAERPAQS